MTSGAGPSTLSVQATGSARRVAAKVRAAEMARSEGAGGLGPECCRDRPSPTSSEQAHESRCFGAPAASNLDGQDDEPTASRPDELGVGVLFGEARKSERRALLAALVAPRSAARVDGKHERCIDRELRPVPQRQTIGDDGNTTLIVPVAAVGEVPARLRSSPDRGHAAL